MEVERCCQTDGSAAGVSSEMVGVARRLIVSFSEIAFQGEEDVASLPVPVEAIEVGIEGVIGRKFRNIGMIGLFVWAKIKTNGPIRGGGDVVKNELKSMPFGITPGVLIRKFDPFTCVFFQGKSRKKEAESGKGESFFFRIFVTERV